MHMLSDSLHVYSVDVHFGNKYLIKGFLDCPNAKESVCTCGKQHLHRVFIVGARRSVMRDMGHTRYLNLGSVCITFWIQEFGKALVASGRIVARRSKETWTDGNTRFEGANK